VNERRRGASGCSPFADDVCPTLAQAGTCGASLGIKQCGQERLGGCAAGVGVCDKPQRAARTCAVTGPALAWRPGIIDPRVNPTVGGGGGWRGGAEGGAEGGLEGGFEGGLVGGVEGGPEGGVEGGFEGGIDSGVEGGDKGAAAVAAEGVDGGHVGGDAGNCKSSVDKSCAKLGNLN